MADQSDMIQKAMGWLDQAAGIAMGWLLSPAAWSQFGLLAAAYLIARLADGRLSPLLRRLLTPPEGKTGLIATSRLFALRFLPLMLPLLAYALTAGGETVTRSLFGSGEVIAFGKRVFLFLAARQFVSRVLTDRFLNLLGRYVLIPVAAL